MTFAKALAIIIGIIWLSVAAQAADKDGQSSEAEAPPSKCLEALVNPVTGFAFCVNPRGAPVDPPPAEAFKRPCKKRAHDDDPFTVYERYSGCH